MEGEKDLIHNEVLPDRSTINGSTDMRYDSIETEMGQECGGEVVRTSGLTVLTATVFIIGEIAGSGVLALPSAIANAGWMGALILVVCCGLSGYNGIQLGKCWDILQERWPEYRGHVRYPYPSIGERAMGKYMRYVVSVAVDVTLFGVATVFMLLAAENLQLLFHMAGVQVSQCYWLLVLTTFFIPVSWLGTPKDFWPIAVGAAVATGIACTLITINIGLDSENVSQASHPPSNGFQSFFLAFGAILFSFGGAAVFPTVQNDMQRPKDFSKVVLFGYGSILSMYLPVALAGYIVYGNNLTANGKANILQVLSPGPLLITVEILITAHLLMAFVIALNPFAQELESIFKIPPKFCLYRCILRTVLVLCVLFTAESIPHFGAVLDLIGGSSVTFLTFVAPSIFYLKLTSMKDENGIWPERIVPLHIKVLNVEIIIIGIIGGVAATYSAIRTMVGADTFIPPCYVNLTAASAFT